MHYDPIMCMMVPDKGTKTKDAERYAKKQGLAVDAMTTDAEYKIIGADRTHYVTAKSAEEAIKKFKKEYGWGGFLKAYKVSDSKKAIDKAIRNCDATSVSSAKSGLKSKIDNWYRNAKIDYGVSGKFVDVREESGALVVYWEEDGKRKRYSFGKYWNDYSVEQLYNIWMEQAD